MKFAAFEKGVPENFEIVLADVGSAGGLHKRWQAIRPIISGLLFEPREGGEVKRQGRDTIYPIALGPSAGTARLNITALANMSSTLLPNRSALTTFRKKDKHTEIVSSFDMPVDTLDAVIRADGRQVDAIKVDTQGSELSILEGAATSLSSQILLAEVEVSFFQRYEGQATACDVIGFMDDRGFDLLDLYRLKRYRRKNESGIANLSLGGGQRAGRLAYGDAIFMIKEERLFSRIEKLPRYEAENVVLKAIIGLLIYGKPDMASYLFDQTRDVFEEGRKACWTKFFQRLARGPFPSGILHHVADYVGRHV